MRSSRGDDDVDRLIGSLNLMRISGLVPRVRVGRGKDRAGKGGRRGGRGEEGHGSNVYRWVMGLFVLCADEEKYACFVIGRGGRLAG